MAAALTLTMDRSRLTCLVVSFVFYMHLAKSTMSLDITRHDFGMRQLRKRRQEKCSETFNVFEGQYDVNAQLDNGEPVGNAAWWCMLNAHCMGFVVKGEKVFFSSSTNRSFINDTFAITYTVNLRCPSTFRCGNSPCKNGGMCRREWKCWCCEQLMSRADEPCDLEETFATQKPQDSYARQMSPARLKMSPARLQLSATRLKLSPARILSSPARLQLSPARLQLSPARLHQTKQWTEAY